MKLQPVCAWALAPQTTWKLHDPEFIATAWPRLVTESTLTALLPVGSIRGLRYLSLQTSALGHNQNAQAQHTVNMSVVSEKPAASSAPRFISP